MKKSSIFSIIFPTVIMVLMFLTFATDIFNIPDIQSKSIFVVGMVLIFPISFLIQGIICVLNKTNWILSLIVSLVTYIVLMMSLINICLCRCYSVSRARSSPYHKIKRR
ncbi:hypothetical protein, partial [Clostridioides difficile]|uniref:hypothetical protein n=1 Tax=Clostridioides difficile TaxID=1496 RepID=UPI001F3D4DCE